jgi:hypothetical protein
MDKILATLRPEHPRVLAVSATFDAIRASVRAGGLPAKTYAEVKKSADQMLDAPVSKYEKPDGKRLLSVSRRVLDRVRTLALVQCVEGNPRYADRVWKELEAAAAFPDWNPPHFLDTAEMTHAFALGYDWLYGHWSQQQRRVLREAIASLGLRPGLKVYDSKKGWPRNENNWNQICNGGLISGALTIADEESQLAARIVHEAVRSVPLSGVSATLPTRASTKLGVSETGRPSSLWDCIRQGTSSPRRMARSTATIRRMPCRIRRRSNCSKLGSKPRMARRTSG